jgi:hypothetical protein
VELTALASRAAGDDLPPAAPGLIAASADHAPPAARPSPASERGGVPPADSTAELAVKIAKELQASALEDFKAGINAALDYAKNLVDTRVAAAGAPEAGGVARPDTSVLTGAASQYHAESLELAKANVETALSYANELVGARTPGEFVELSSELARKQCEFALKQAGALKAFARAITKSDPER